jgi:hypothetical protein
MGCRRRGRLSFLRIKFDVYYLCRAGVLHGIWNIRMRTRHYRRLDTFVNLISIGISFATASIRPSNCPVYAMVNRVNSDRQLWPRRFALISRLHPSVVLTKVSQSNKLPVCIVTHLTLSNFLPETGTPPATAMFRNESKQGD